MRGSKAEASTRCKNCSAVLNGRFCSACGQKAYTDKDDSVYSMAKEALHFVTHFEGKFLTTLKTIFGSPGQMSLDHANGIRQRYYKPISLYLMLVVLYLVFPMFQGLNMHMTTYEQTFLGGTFTSLIEGKASVRGVSVDEIGERFDEKSRTTSKVLLLVLIPLTAPILRVLLGRGRKWYHDLVLATEVNAFYLLVFYLIAPLVVGLVITITGVKFQDEAMALAFVGFFAAYGAVLLHRIQPGSWWRSALKGTALAVMHTAMLVFVYKPLLFLATMALL